MTRYSETVTEALYQSGDRVRILDATPPVHHRVPAYAKGAVGEIERVCDAFGQPETLSVGGTGEPNKTLYRVRLRQVDLWRDYSGNAADTLEIEIFEHWLEKAPAT